MSFPEVNASEVALEAGVSQERAAALIAASWKLAENFTGQVYDDATPAAHVTEAVRCLALYQLIHSPARREFRTITAADSTLTREALGPLFKMSGAGILLASEVIWKVGTDVAIQEET